MTRLKKLEPVVIPKIIISIHVMELGRVVCFAFSDGTLQYRDRVTMNEVYTEHNTLSIMHPSQIGFHFTNETPGKAQLLRGPPIVWLSLLTYHTQLSKLPSPQQTCRSPKFVRMAMSSGMGCSTPWKTRMQHYKAVCGSYPQFVI